MKKYLLSLILVIAIAIISLTAIFIVNPSLFGIKGLSVKKTGAILSEGVYKNNEIGFEFAYPKEWKLSERKIQNGLSIKLFPDSKSNKGSLTISIESKPYTFCGDCNTLDEAVKENIKILQTTVQDKLVPHEGKINGIRFVEVNYRTREGYQGDSSLFIVDGKLYTISYFELSDIANKYEDEYRDIAKSFRFETDGSQNQQSSSECIDYTLLDGQEKSITLSNNEYLIKIHIEAEDKWASFSVNGNKGERGAFYNSWGNPLMMSGNTNKVPDNLVIDGVSIKLKQIGYDNQNNEFATICIGK